MDRDRTVANKRELHLHGGGAELQAVTHPPTNSPRSPCLPFAASVATVPRTSGPTRENIHCSVHRAIRPGAVNSYDGRARPAVLALPTCAPHLARSARRGTTAPARAHHPLRARRYVPALLGATLVVSHMLSCRRRCLLLDR
jgi:hypothetical protein